MAERRQSIVQEVVGLPAEDALLLSTHDEEFFYAGVSVAESAALDVDDPEDHGDGAGADQPLAEPADSDDDEDLDQADAATATADEPPCKRAKPSLQPTSAEEIETRCAKGCSCRNKNCFRLVSPHTLLQSRNKTELLNTEALQMYLAGKLDALARSGVVSHHQTAGEAAHESRVRRTYEYAVAGSRVCLETFVYAHSCSRYLVHKVESHLARGTITFAAHGKTGAVPWNTIPEEERTSVVAFIKNYADRFGLPQPSAPRGHNKPAPIYLPCHTTKLLLHSDYIQAGGEVSYTTFRRIWKVACPDIVIMRPREDVCAVCSNLQSKIFRAITEEERVETTGQLQQHMDKAIFARDFYRSCITKGKLAINLENPDATPEYTHLTFDFAQQATIPHHARQVGALYFKVPRRIQIFGVANEAVPCQYNYLVDENETIGIDGSKCHGPNAVITMLHHHLEKHCKPSPHLGLHADNCVGQNKNRSVLAYCAWRVIVGLNVTIQLDFMRVGHTRCFVDAGFGLLKQKYRKADVDTVDQLCKVIDESASINHSEKYCWEWRQWDQFLAKSFRPLKNVTAYQRFFFSSESPGYVQISLSNRFPDKSVKILSSAANVAASLNSASLPPVLPPAGISFARQEYLFQQIRPYCHAESRDTTCPQPVLVAVGEVEVADVPTEGSHTQED